MCLVSAKISEICPHDSIEWRTHPRFALGEVHYQSPDEISPEDEKTYLKEKKIVKLEST